MSLRELSLFDRKLPEETLHPVENVVSFGRLGPLEGRLCGQLLHQPLLLGIELGGDRNIHHDQYIAASVTVHVGQALAGQPQQRAGEVRSEAVEFSLASPLAPRAPLHP